MCGEIKGDDARVLAAMLPIGLLGTRLQAQRNILSPSTLLTQKPVIVVQKETLGFL